MLLRLIFISKRFDDLGWSIDKKQLQLILCTTEKRDAPSANKSVSPEDKLSDSSLRYIKKNSGPRIDP